MKAAERNARMRLFAKTWNQAPSPGDAARKLNMKTSTATAIAALWRCRGVPLKLFAHSTRQKDIDWKALAAYARRFLP